MGQKAPIKKQAPEKVTLGQEELENFLKRYEGLSRRRRTTADLENLGYGLN